MLMDIFCLHLTERPDGERGNETALPAVGACLSHTQLPEPHSGESAATVRPGSRAVGAQDVTLQVNHEVEEVDVRMAKVETACQNETSRVTQTEDRTHRDV